MPSARCRPVPEIADLRAGHERRTVAKSGGRCRTARTLSDVLVDLAVFVRSGAEAFDRGNDHARIELVNVLEGEPHAVERAGREILHQHVAFLHQPVEDFLALRMLAVDRDRALAAIEHGEIETVGAFHVAKLAARDVADAGPFHLDDVGAHEGEQLGAGRPRLHVREIEDAHTVERPARLSPRHRRRSRQPVAVRRFGRRLFCCDFHRLLCRLLGRGFHRLAGGLFCRRSGFVRAQFEFCFLARCHQISLLTSCASRALHNT